MKTTVQQLLDRVEHKPNPILYTILRPVVSLIKAPTHTKFIFKAHPGEDKGPFVLVSNHASRNDYIFTAPACYPRRLNYVVGYNEFFRFPVNLLLRIMQVIPKKNFTPDIHCIKSIQRIIRSGGAICIMPEGMSSITGMAQPVMPGIGKLMKKLKVNVYYTKISGGYMTWTKHCLDTRSGRCEVVVDKMFSAEDFDNLTEAQIEDTMNRLLAHDDYIWNETAKVRFDGKGQMAKQLDTLLYRCPKCGKVYDMTCEGNTMKCNSCGNTISVDETYRIEAVGEGSVCPRNVTDWTIWEREKAAEAVREPGFIKTGHVQIGVLPEHKWLVGSATSIIKGSGTLTLTEDGLTFSGILEDKPFDFHLPTDAVPTYGMCTDISRFYTFVDGRFIEFYPDEGDVLLWDHLTEEMHRFKGGKWQNTPYRHEQ